MTAETLAETVTVTLLLALTTIVVGVAALGIALGLVTRIAVRLVDRLDATRRVGEAVRPTTGQIIDWPVGQPPASRGRPETRH